MNCDLSSLLEEIKKHSSYKPHDGKFPTVSSLTRYPNKTLSIIVDEGERLLLEDQNRSNDDLDPIKNQFISDTYQFLTENSISINSKTIALYGQKVITSNALYHIASSQQYKAKYLNIDLNMNKVEFNYYSIPFVLRLALESKLKAMLGFKHCDVTRTIRGKKKTFKNTREFPVTKVLTFLGNNDLVTSPCLFNDLKNIYSWSCRFTHDATKEYIWLRLKAIRMLNNLFDFEYGKENHISEEYSNTLCYLNKGVSLESLMMKINNDLKFKGHHKLYLSKLSFDEIFGFYSQKERKWY